MSYFFEKRTLIINLRRPTLLGFLVLFLILDCCPLNASEQEVSSTSSLINILRQGETLSYDVSWSNIVTAGIATMEAKEGTMPDGKQILRFIVKTHSVGFVNMFFPVNDTVESVFDPESMQSLSFRLNETHGKKKRSRELLFDHAGRIVVSKLNDDQPETYAVPDPVQDALSSFYYLRIKEDFTVGKTIVVDVHDSRKNWSVEVQILGKEMVKTPAGEFATIKIRTYPKYEGVFKHKGEIFIWLTDDIRKIPVLMKSTIAIGSIVTTLTSIQ